MLPVLIKIGSLKIYSFGLMMALAFIITGYLFRKELKRVGRPVDLSESITLSALLGGVLGAKIYSVIESIVQGEGFIYSIKGFFSGSGLVWYGGFIGGTIAVILVMRWKHAPLMKTLDLIAPLLILGYACGRMGCFLSGDGDYGPPSDLPWAMGFPKGTVPTPPGIKVHPTPLYEIILSLIFFAYMWRIRKKSRPAGWMFGLYLILAGIERFVMEYWRETPKILFNAITLAQIVSIAMIAIGVIMLVRLRKAPIPIETPIIEEINSKDQKHQTKQKMSARQRKRRKHI